MPAIVVPELAFITHSRLTYSLSGERDHTSPVTISSPRASDVFSTRCRSSRQRRCHRRRNTPPMPMNRSAYVDWGMASIRSTRIFARLRLPPR